MASTSKKKTGTKSKTSTNQSKRTTPKKTEEQRAAQKQIAAVVLFAIALFGICLSFINGGGAWGFCRNVLFGLFGFCAYVIPLILIYVAIMTTLDKSTAKVGFKVGEAMLLIILISSMLHIFEFTGSVHFWQDLVDAYNVFRLEHSFLGSGSVGAFFGGLILLATGSSKPAAIAVAVILTFLCIMLMTGTTLVRLLKGIEKPVQKVNEYREEKLEKIALQEAAIKENEANFQVDVDMGPKPKDTNGATDDTLEELSPLPKKKREALNRQFDTADETAQDSSIEPDELQKPVLLDDIIKKMHMQEEKSEENTDPQKIEIPKIVPIPCATSAISKENEGDTEPVVYEKPPISCLAAPKNQQNNKYEEELKTNATKLVDTLKSFGVETRIVDICRGPSVTRYEIQPAAGVKISRITNLTDDIALNLAAGGIRIEAPIPNKAAVGVEVPNKNRSLVTFREMVDTEQYKSAKSRLNVALGKDITGNCTYTDLAKMPHLLVAGTTGSGKSVCLNAMIVSILYNASPDEVKLLMIDPKQVEFTVYNGIPHLIVPVVSDPRKASGALAWAVTEMLTRYKMFSDNNVRDIKGYNAMCESIGQKKMPQIVIFIDELSDLMMAAPHEVEDSICRLAQMARAAGMHLVIATQRPSVDVITGLIKANIPSRISLKVSSQIDSRTIIDTAGAEKLLGNGDMLFYPVGLAKPLRIQGCFLSDKEVEDVVNYIKQEAPQSKYDDEVMQEIERQAAADTKKKSVDSSGDEDTDADEMIPKAIELVVEAQMASTTLLQRKLKLGYARAARIMDNLEERGIIGPYEGSKPRKVLISKQQWYEMNALAQGGASRDYSAEDTVESSVILEDETISSETLSDIAESTEA